MSRTVVDFILNNIDQGNYVGAIFLDLKKAFDTVNHTILISKLQSIGVCGLELHWFSSYLSERKQATRVGKSLSALSPVEFGVPQGSILGPLLFTVYVNDLSAAVSKCKIDLYADDTAMFYASKSIDDINKVLNTNMHGVDNWLLQHRLTLNVSKTKAMLFGSAQKLANAGPLSVNIRGQQLECVSNFKYLGVTLDQRLTWECHIDKLCPTLYKYAGLFYRIRKFLPIDALKLLYTAVVLPKVDYCDMIWSNSGQTLLLRLDRYQKRLGRAILNVPMRTPTNSVFESLGWETFSSRRQYHICLNVYKSLGGIFPPNQCNIFTRCADSYGGYNLRSSSAGNLVLSTVHLETGKRAFQYRGATAWNNLPVSIKNTLPKNAAAFKSIYYDVV